MHFIEGIIYFGVYAVFVLILTSIYVVFFEKTVKAKMHKSENLEREKREIRSKSRPSETMIKSLSSSKTTTKSRSPS